MNKIWKLLIGFIVVIIIVFTLYQNGLLNVKDVDQMGENLRELGIFAIIILVLLIVLQQILTFVPFLSLATINVMVYGLWGGFVLSWLASLLGALVAFWLARTTLHNWIENRWGGNETFKKINHSLATSGFFYVLMGRLFPVMPSNLINFGAGISKISVPAYAVATVFGNIPFVFTTSLLGYDLLHLANEANKDRFIYVSIGLAVFVIINLIVKYAFDKRKRLDTSTGK